MLDKAKAIRIEKLCYIARKVCGVNKKGEIRTDTFGDLSKEDRLKITTLTRELTHLMENKSNMKAIVRGLTPPIVRENIK